MMRRIIEPVRVADDVPSPLLDSFGWGNHTVLAVLSRGTLEGGNYSDCVGLLCTFCLVLTYLLLHLRLRDEICPAVPTVVVPK